MGKYSEAFVAFDVAKKKHAVAIAEGGRTGEVRFMGDVENNPAPIERTIKRLANRYDRLHVSFEAGPTGYGLYRQVQALGHDCMVVAPALIPKRAGERIKTNRRDAVTLARLYRAGELTGVWAPDPAHEAVRDLARAREAAGDDLRRKRQQLLLFPPQAQPDLQRRRPLDAGASALAGRSEVRPITSVTFGRGSEGPRAIIAYYYAFLHTARRYSSCAFCPIVIDAPNQQGQDDMQRVMRFIIDKRPPDSQVIVATEDVFGLTESDATIVHVGERVNQLLDEDKYDEVSDIVRPYLEHLI